MNIGKAACHRIASLFGRRLSVRLPVACFVRLSTTAPRMATTPTISDYGSWVSPITSALATQDAISFTDAKVDPKNNDVMYWSELRYNEKGRYVVCSYDPSASTPISEWTPAEMSARTLAHEYGGGAFFPFDGSVYFSNKEDGRLYRQDNPTATPVPLTPADAKFRFADGTLHGQTGVIYMVREDHTKVATKERSEPENTVVALNPASGSLVVLASGADFYASPRVSPDGKTLCWMQWSHPNMPWDCTSIYVADLDNYGMASSNTRLVAGGDDKSMAAMQPRFLPDNRLMYISDESDWWNIYRLDYRSGAAAVSCTPVPREVGGPQWVFGYSSYDPSLGGDIPFIEAGALKSLSTADWSIKAIDTGFTSHSYVYRGGSGSVYCVADSGNRFSSVIRVDQDGKVTIVKESAALTVDEGYLSSPVHISFKTTNGETAHGYYYAPKNKDYAAPDGRKPPLLVKNHGGPTSSAMPGLKLKYQYFTSRGFAIMDVNCRGSTGYGRAFRMKLQGNWGVYDVEDASNAALHLVAEGLVDNNRLCIDGGSAGGYTTLSALAFTNTFGAGCSNYGIADLEVLAKETHKFEARYLDRLVAPYPEGKAIYQARSSSNHIDGFNCPVCLFQGSDDKVVPPNQAAMIFDALKVKGVPCSMTVFEGEQHGFRQAANIQKAMDGEYYFFARVFGMDSHFDKPVVDICNEDALPQYSGSN